MIAKQVYSLAVSRGRAVHGTGSRRERRAAGRRNKIPIFRSNDNKSKLKVVKYPEKEGNLHTFNMYPRFLLHTIFFSEIQ